MLALLSLAASRPEAPAPYVFFTTPSRRIGCMYAVERTTTLRCDIVTGLKPPPPRPRGCSLDWRYGYEVSARGRARAVCAGDTVIAEHSTVLRYGTTWRRGPFTCVSRLRGLRCRNASGRGFFLSRTHSYRF